MIPTYVMDFIQTAIPWAVALLVTFLALRLKPIEQTQAEHKERLDKLENMFDKYAENSTNYDRWRGQVSKSLQVVEEEIGRIRTKLDA